MRRGKGGEREGGVREREGRGEREGRWEGFYRRDAREGQSFFYLEKPLIFRVGFRLHIIYFFFLSFLVLLILNPKPNNKLNQKPNQKNRKEMNLESLVSTIDQTEQFSLFLPPPPSFISSSFISSSPLPPDPRRNEF